MTTPILQSITDELLAEIEADFDPSCSQSEKMESGGYWGDYVPLIIARLRAAEVLLAGAEERARLLLDSKNQWADRARAAELDAKRLEFMLADGCVMQSQNGTASPFVFRLYWPHEGEQQDAWYPTEREAIDAAMERQP